MGQRGIDAFPGFERRHRRGPIGLALGLAVLFSGSCRGPAPERGPEAEVYPFPAHETRAFVAGPSGLAPLEAPEIGESGRLVLSAGEVGPGAVLVALGAYGLALIEPDGRGEAYRIRSFPSPSFGSLDPGGAWPHGAGFLVQLFRNPLAPSAEGAAASERLFILDADGLRSLGLGAPAETVASGGELFALFPDPRSSRTAWLAQFRSEGEGRDQPVRSSYASFGRLEEPGLPLDRGTFEDLLRPRPLSGGIPELREAAGLLGAEAMVVRLRDAEGGESYWYAGSESTARPVEAWRDRERLIALGPDGRGAFSGSLGSMRLSFEAPLPGALFDSVVFLGTEAGVFVVASWERVTDQGRVSGLLVHTFEHLR